MTTEYGQIGQQVGNGTGKPAQSSVEDELCAMQTVATAIEKLDREAAERACCWAVMRHAAMGHKAAISGAISELSKVFDAARAKAADRGA